MAHKMTSSPVTKLLAPTALDMLVSGRLPEHAGYSSPSRLVSISFHLEYSFPQHLCTLLPTSFKFTQMSSHPGRSPLILHIRQHQPFRVPLTNTASVPRLLSVPIATWLFVSLSISSSKRERSLFCSPQVGTQSHAQ